VPDVQPINNQAEQALRNIVISRKIRFGTRSPEGSLSHSILPSLLLCIKILRDFRALKNYGYFETKN